MLIIRRKPGEALLIGDQVEIQVIDISPSRVKLGITAPSNVFILRKEILLASEQNRAAAGGVTPDAIRAVVSLLRFPAAVRPAENP